MKLELQVYIINLKKNRHLSFINAFMILDVEDIMTKLNIILDDHEHGKNFKSVI